MEGHQLSTATEEQFEKQEDGKGQKSLHEKAGNFLVICPFLW